MDTLIHGQWVTRLRLRISVISAVRSTTAGSTAVSWHLMRRCWWSARPLRTARCRCADTSYKLCIKNSHYFLIIHLIQDQSKKKSWLLLTKFLLKAIFEFWSNLLFQRNVHYRNILSKNEIRKYRRRHVRSWWTARGPIRVDLRAKGGSGDERRGRVVGGIDVHQWHIGHLKTQFWLYVFTLSEWICL